MKWFKHMTDSHSNSSINLLRGEWGMAGIGMYWTLLELVASEQSKMKTSSEYSYKQLQMFLGLKQKKLVLFLECLQNVFTIKFIFHEKSVIIEWPKVAEIQDIYTRNKTKDCSVSNQPYIEEKRREEIRIEETNKKERKKEEITETEFALFKSVLSKINVFNREPYGHVKARNSTMPISEFKPGDIGNPVKAHFEPFHRIYSMLKKEQKDIDKISELVFDYVQHLGNQKFYVENGNLRPDTIFRKSNFDKHRGQMMEIQDAEESKPKTLAERLDRA